MAKDDHDLGRGRKAVSNGGGGGSGGSISRLEAVLAEVATLLVAKSP